MTDPGMHSKKIVEKLSRRKLLRNSTIAATGVVLLPPFITGCSKDENSGLGGVRQFTPEQLKQAADNVNRMRALLNDLYNTAFKYDETVFLALASTKENGSWTNFLADIFIDIAFLAAAA